MAAQRTFTLIPPISNNHLGESPERGPASARPMTSKQVRKAYKASTRTPPMSRVERIKQEKAEQERIRKDFEKEKAAAKARLAREKKKGRESAEREQKKKLGMPLVNVRPSQDTIARFVRGNGTAMKRNAAGSSLSEGNKQNILGYADNKYEEQAKPLSRTPDERPELDLISEEDDSGFEELLNTIANNQGHTKSQIETKPNTPEINENKLPKAANRPIAPPPPRPSLPLQMPQASTPPKVAQPPICKQLPQPISSPPIIHQPPISTQAILGNLDDYFPSLSQQARELQDDTFNDSFNATLGELESAILNHPSNPVSPAHYNKSVLQPSSPPLSPPPPKRFFTPSGSNELISLAIQRSRRTAALEVLQEQEISQAQISTKTNTSNLQTRHPPHSSKPFIITSKQTKEISTPDKTYLLDTTNKENVPLEPQFSCSPGNSQETEYGGDWVDELAIDFII
ncbi:hypothetical protein QQS21_003715 [Conoideocrella luteorostrata]|uniref:Uncharacterized protein n=1 Tax=Conoideocrella luteorostrata TaxID=1105319 RepID=A0AAJ0CVL3_9HYPO|nr:hypothetical protein QQS21_003715 [Conoideocrella luteorostrata]